jgi:hypothetical protein
MSGSLPGQRHDIPRQAGGGVRHTTIAGEVVDVDHVEAAVVLGKVEAIQAQTEGLSAAPGEALDLG